MFDPIKIQRWINRAIRIEVLVIVIVVSISIGMFINMMVQRNLPAKTSVTEQSQVSSTRAPEPSPSPTPAPDPYAVSEQLSAAREQNPDVVGWLAIPDTQIDYPVVCGPDNDFYLNHDILGNESQAGSIYQDFRNGGSFLSRHVILYGHNMKDGTMFHDLRYYKDRDFAMQNGQISIETAQGMTTWQVFSSYVMTTDFYVIRTDFTNDQDYQEFLDTLAAKSEFDYGIEVAADQSILTLLTCSYELDDARFVVHAVKVR